MARVAPAPRRTPFLRLIEWYSRRRFGAVLDPGAVLAHNGRVLRTYFRHEMSLARWDRLDPTLKALGVMSSAVGVVDHRVQQVLLVRNPDKLAGIGSRG